MVLPPACSLNPFCLRREVHFALCPSPFPLRGRAREGGGEMRRDMGKGAIASKQEVPPFAAIPLGLGCSLSLCLGLWAREREGAGAGAGASLTTSG